VLSQTNSHSASSRSLCNLRARCLSNIVDKNELVKSVVVSKNHNDKRERNTYITCFIIFVTSTFLQRLNLNRPLYMYGLISGFDQINSFSSSIGSKASSTECLMRHTCKRSCRGRIFWLFVIRVSHRHSSFRLCSVIISFWVSEGVRRINAKDRSAWLVRAGEPWWNSRRQLEVLPRRFCLLDEGFCFTNFPLSFFVCFLLLQLETLRAFCRFLWFLFSLIWTNELFGLS
jgi:hypothetical protein